MNEAIAAAADTVGFGEALALRLERVTSSGDPRFAACSLLYETYRAKVPVTVHVAIGTDTPHTHPAADGAAIGSATHRDFRLFCNLVTGLDRGGIYLDIGLAVVLAVVFPKGVLTVRELGIPRAAC